MRMADSNLKKWIGDYGMSLTVYSSYGEMIYF